MRVFSWKEVSVGRGAHLVSWRWVGKAVNLGVLELGNLKLVIKTFWLNGFGSFLLSLLPFGLGL